MIDTRANRAALLAAALIAALPAVAQAEPLSALFDACDRVLSESTYAGVAGYGLVKFEDQMVALVDTDEGRVTVSVAEWPERGIHECAISGYDLRRAESAAQPTLTTAQALPIAQAWLARRAQAEDAGRLPDLYGNGSISIAICPGKDDRGGHFATHHAEVRYRGVDLPPEDRAMHFRIGRNAPGKNTPCQFKERFAK